MKIKVKLLKADGTVIFSSEELTVSKDGSVIEVAIPESAKATLNEAATITIVLPVYNEKFDNGAGGTAARVYAEFSGVWVDGEVNLEEYTVTFNSLEGSAVESATVTEGEKVTKPTDPTRDGYTFDGWYKESTCSNAWNFETDTVTENTTLYAKWTNNVVTPNPDEPTDAVRVDADQAFVKNSKQGTYIEVKKAEDGVTTVTVKGQALKATDESNYVSLSLATIDVSNATKITLNVKGYWFKEVNKENEIQEGTVKITVKLSAEDGTIILTETVALTQQGSVSKLKTLMMRWIGR